MTHTPPHSTPLHRFIDDTHPRVAASRHHTRREEAPRVEFRVVELDRSEVRRSVITSHDIQETIMGHHTYKNMCLLHYIHVIQPSHVYPIGSRQITEVKQRWAR